MFGGVSSKTEDIALEVIKSIFSTRDRVGVMDNTIESFNATNKRLAFKFGNVKNDMNDGSETITAFYNNNFLRKDSYELLVSLRDKGALGIPVIDAMIKSNKEDNKIKKKGRSLLIQPIITLVAGFIIGNYLLSTGVSIVKDNPEFRIKLSGIHEVMADNLLMVTAAEVGLLIPFIIWIVNFLMIKTGGIFRYLYKANVMIYFLRKAKTPFKSIFGRVKELLPSGARAKAVVENMEDEIEIKNISEVLKDYLRLYPFQIYTTKMPQISRGDDTDVFLELAQDSLTIYDEFANKISSSMPIIFLFLTMAYVGFSLLPLFDFIGAAMNQQH